MKKILTTLMFVLFCTVLLKPVDVKAVEFKDLGNPTVEDMSNFDVSVTTGQQCDWNLKLGETQHNYTKFTLDEECYVRIRIFEEGFKSGWAVTNGTITFFRIYTNPSLMQAAKFEKKLLNDYEKESDDYLKLGKGTYYIDCNATEFDKDRKYTTKYTIGAVPTSNVVEYTQKYNENDKTATVTLKQKFADSFYPIRWQEGKDTFFDGLEEEIDPSTLSFKVSKNGWYTVKLITEPRVNGEKIEHYVFVYVDSIKENVTAPEEEQKEDVKKAAVKGKTYKVGSLKYKVTKNNTNGTGTVCVMGATKKKPTAITIPKTVKIADYTYTITKINSKAFYKKSKLKKVTIKATGIKSIGKRAFSGIYKKARIYVPKSKYKSYSKMLKKAGVTSSMKIRKK